MIPLSPPNGVHNKLATESDAQGSNEIGDKAPSPYVLTPGAPKWETILWHRVRGSRVLSGTHWHQKSAAGKGEEGERSSMADEVFDAQCTGA